MPGHKSYIPHGVIPAVLLPFETDLSIDEPNFRRHLADVASVEGLSAITINAHSTEVSSCTFDEQKRVLDIATKEAGPFRGPMVVSMRPLKPADAIRAVQITTRFPSVHGAPVHIGKPELIGIKDIDKPDYGDRVEVRDDELPVFWACGVTPQSVIATVKPEFCITHYPGSMLVTDRKNTEFAIM